MDATRELADKASKLGMRMLQHVNQALGSVDPQLVMTHVREAMGDGEELQDTIDQTLESTTEGTPASQKINIASDHLREAMTAGAAAITASENFIKDRVQEMREHVEQTLSNLNLAALPLGR